MDQIKQKNFKIPRGLLKEWAKLTPRGSKEGSKHAAAALLVYLELPSPIRALASDAVRTQRTFRLAEKCFDQQLSSLADLDKNLLARVLIGRAEAREADSHKTKDGMAAKLP